MERVEVEEERLLKLENAVMRDDKVEEVALDAEDFGFSSYILTTILQSIYEDKLRKKLEEREILELSLTLDSVNRAINLLEEREMEWKRTFLSGENPSFTALIQGITALKDYRKTVVYEIKSRMREECPNLSALTGEILGARLIAKAGGKKELAHLPSSTIQILGAENAFFRFRKTGEGMPKHGLIFQHPLIKGTQKRFRGKAARALASGIVVAARIDYFSGRDLGDVIKERIEKRIKDMRRMKEE